MELRNTFDTVADLYERARPGYPDELVDELVASIDGGRVLEVGSGTGKLTRSLVARNLDVTCIEPGANLAFVSRRVLPDTRVVEERFEEWVPDGRYDAVCCAAAWHWLDPEIAPRRAHEALKPGGILAVMNGHHVFPDDADPFFVEIQRTYDAIGHGVDELPGPDDIRHDDAVRLRATGLFDVEDRAWLRVVEYDASSYIDLLRTFSGHIVMTPEEQETIFAAVRRLAGDRVIRKHHLFCLHLATRVG